MIPITPQTIKELKLKKIYEYLEQELFKDVKDFNYNNYSSIRKKLVDKFNTTDNEANEIRDAFFKTGSKNRYFLDNYDKLQIIGKKYHEYLDNKLNKLKQSHGESFSKDIQDDFLSNEFQIVLSKTIEAEKSNNKEEYYKRLFTFDYLDFIYDNV